jgi:hypothetical protein
MPDPTELLVSAFSKFINAGFDGSVAKYGLFGHWVEPAKDVAASIRDRAVHSASRWSGQYGAVPNPYSDVIAFIDSGSTFGRWENNVLDVFLQDGSKYGIPLSSFLRAAAN